MHTRGGEGEGAGAGCCGDAVLLLPFRERPTSPSTAEAIQGMLSMAGLLCSSEPERVASSQDPWWPSPKQREAAQHQRHLQADENPMDSQGNSREAWDNQGLPSPLSRGHGSSPEMDFQYCEPSMSPPLHPSKRQAPNPPPVSNQATKGLDPARSLAPFLTAVVNAWPSSPGKRPKKGMATAKQRLGKILKLNRHSRVFV